MGFAPRGSEPEHPPSAELSDPPSVTSSALRNASNWESSAPITASISEPSLVEASSKWSTGIESQPPSAIAHALSRPVLQIRGIIETVRRARC
jgi:hypothetical protein